MEFLVEFKVKIPAGTPATEVERRERAEAAAAAELAREGTLVRLWNQPVGDREANPLGLYRAESTEQLRLLLDALPLGDWLHVAVTPLEPHPNDPANARAGVPHLPEPRLSPVYRLEATLGDPLELGDAPRGRRRIVPLTGGDFRGPELAGTLLPGGSADWQTILADGTTLGDIRYTLRTESDELLYVQSRGVRHGDPDVLARLARGEDVSPTEYTFRTATQIETASTPLDWMNKGVFIGVAGRQARGVVYEIYLVG
jgi:muconolactone delta-isomerase